MSNSVSAAAAALAVVVASVATVGAGARSGAGGIVRTSSPKGEAIVLANAAQRVYITRIYQDGKVVARVGRSGRERSWGYGDSGECWVEQEGRIIYAGITHDTFGGGRAVGPHKWKVWVGKRLAGVIVWHSRSRWDLIRTSRLNRFDVDMGPLGSAGYTIGPDGPAAGTAFLLLGACE